MEYKILDSTETIAATYFLLEMRDGEETRVEEIKIRKPRDKVSEEELEEVVNQRISIWEEEKQEAPTPSTNEAELEFLKNLMSVFSRLLNDYKDWLKPEEMEVFNKVLVRHSGRLGNPWFPGLPVIKEEELAGLEG